MAIHALDEKAAASSAEQVKIDLAAALRLAALHQLEEGIDNHFTAVLPGHDDQFVMLPFGYHWSEARASDMIVFNEAGETLDGDGAVEITAQCIHAPIHRITGARVVMHTHQPWALALNMLENNRLLPATQTAALIHKVVAYDDDYSGLATALEEGERLAEILGDKSILFLKNHGVIVAANSIAMSYKLLYMVERVCRTQVLAMSAGEPITLIDPAVASALQTPNESDRHQGKRHILFFDAMKRVLDRENPGYAD